MKKLFPLLLSAFVIGCSPATSGTSSETMSGMQCKCCKDMKEKGCCCKGMMKGKDAKDMGCCCKGITSDGMDMGDMKGDRPMCDKMNMSDKKADMHTHH